MADEDRDEPELELDAEGEQPSDQQAEPEGDQPEVEQGDESEAEPPPLAAQEPVAEEPQRLPSRRDTRIQSLIESNRTKDTELADVRRRLDELTRTVQQPKPAAESPEIRAQRRALMTPQEQMQEDLREAREGFTQQINQLQFQNAESNDRTTFQMSCANNPLRTRLAPKVEGTVAEERAKGHYIPREVAYHYLLGKEYEDKYLSKDRKKEVVQAQQRVKRQTVRPSNSGSDEAAVRRREDSLERRLENLNI